MIITLKTTLLRGRYCEADWSANIELDESATLEDLHDAIQKAVDFDNDHLYCFFMSRTDRSRSREYFDDENELIFTKTLKDLFPLPKKQSLFYLFDWGMNGSSKSRRAGSDLTSRSNVRSTPESRANRESSRCSIREIKTTNDSHH